MRPMDFPKPPSLQNELKEWIDQIDTFKSHVTEILEKNDVLATVKLNAITPEWCARNNKPIPSDYFDSLKADLQKYYQQNAINQEIDQTKVTQFFSSSGQIIDSAIDRIREIGNTNIINDDSDKWNVKGIRILDRKDSFSANPEAHYFNFDRHLAEGWAERLNLEFSYTFLYKRTRYYLLHEGDIFKGIDKLGINKDYVIISFGLNIHNYLHYHKVEGLTIDQYNGVRIYLLPGNKQLLNTLFIIKKSDLPQITSLEIAGDLINKYSLNKISDNYNLYASVLDLNKTNPNIIQEVIGDRKEEEILKFVLCCILINIEIKWKKAIEVIQILEYSEYRQQGLVNNLSEISTVKKEKSQ